MDGEGKIHVLDASWKVSLSARGRKICLTSCHEWSHLFLGELWRFIEIGEFNPTIFDHFLALFSWHPICIMLGGLWRNPIVYSPFCILFSASRWNQSVSQRQWTSVTRASRVESGMKCDQWIGQPVSRALNGEGRMQQSHSPVISRALQPRARFEMCLEVVLDI